MDKKTLPFLSTPTHEPFYVHPQILLERLLQYESTNTKVDLEDLIIACNRILVNRIGQGEYSVTLKKITGYYS